jgi:ribosomal protein S27E
MDVTFSCPQCKQELVVDSGAAGTQIECPACNHTMVVPSPDPANIRVSNPIETSAAAKVERHFVVPMHDEPTEVLIEKPRPPLEVSARDGDKQLRVKCIKRTDCVEVGKDHFDEVVTAFLGKLSEANLVSITPLTYTHLDIGSQKLLTDYGVMIVYRG